jgi:hypothetical protein
MERKEMSRERTPKGGLYATQFLWLLVLIGQQKGENEIHTSINSCHQFFRPARRMSGEKDAPKRMCMQLRYLYLGQFIGSEGKVK